MHSDLVRRRDALAEICRRYGITRLEVFGSAARAADFDPGRSDIDLLVSFSATAKKNVSTFFDLIHALEGVLGRRVDLVERRAVEKSQNYIRRRAILRDVETVYG